MKTLYISDLDGTLLNRNAELSSETIQMLKKAIDSGISFTCATARTAATVVHILSDLNLSMPVVLMNGVAVFDLNTHTYEKVEYINSFFCNQIIERLDRQHTACFIYSIKEHKVSTYYTHLPNRAIEEFYTERVTRYQKPYTKVNAFCEIDTSHIAYYLLLDTKEMLQPLVDWLSTVKTSAEIDFVFYPEIYYEGTWCLEIFSNKASKYNAVQYLRTHYEYDHIIGFGDNLNDLPLFRACDEGYAVENAKEELKELATNVIGSNLDNSVPKFILEHEGLL